MPGVDYLSRFPDDQHGKPQFWSCHHSALGVPERPFLYSTKVSYNKSNTGRRKKHSLFWTNSIRSQSHSDDVQGYNRPFLSWHLKTLTASVRRDSVSSSDKGARKNKQCRTSLHLKSRDHSCQEKKLEKAIYNVLRPSTISGRLRVFNKSLRTSGGQVAESAMIGTDGNSWRNLWSFW